MCSIIKVSQAGPDLLPLIVYYDNYSSFIMMQRGSSNVIRNVLLGTISVLLVLLVLYYMKRGEVKKLKSELDDMLVSKRVWMELVSSF